MGASPRERCQGRTAMSDREVAGLAGMTGLPMGLKSGRVSPFRTKSVFPASVAGSRGARDAVTGVLRFHVLPAITSCVWFVHLTDEVPRCPGAPGPVSARYKSEAKGAPDAPVTGTGSPRPRLQGYQQSRSNPAGWDERQNLRVPSRADGFMGSVSPGSAATKWPGGTSSCQHPGLLRNHPQQPARLRAAVRYC
jgi:hypothetical protein